MKGNKNALHHISQHYLKTFFVLLGLILILSLFISVSIAQEEEEDEEDEKDKGMAQDFGWVAVGLFAASIV